MQFETLWELYLDNNMLDIYPQLKEVFSKKLDPQVLKEYEVGELLVEFSARYESAKAYEEFIEFTELLRKFNPEVYAEEAPYFNDFLINYYCYQGDELLLQRSIDECIDSPSRQYDLLQKSLYVLTFFGYQKQAEDLINRINTITKTSPDFVSFAEGELAKSKFFIAIEQLYPSFQQQNSLDWDALAARLEGFDFDFQETRNQEFEAGFFWEMSTIAEDFPAAFSQDQNKVLIRLGRRFMAYMLERKVPIGASIEIWEHLCTYWANQPGRPKPTNFFNLNKKTFKRYLSKIAGMLIDYRFLPVAILWGSSYAYDFLRSSGLISQQSWEASQQYIQELKQALIQENLADLWTFSFVHTWEKPEMISSEDWEKEKAIFREYHHSMPPENLREQTGEGFFMESELNLLQNLNLSGLIEPTDWSEPPREEKVVPPRRKLPKIGRNEKITVKYTDGRILEDVKFKKVSKDLENGDCEIV